MLDPCEHGNQASECILCERNLLMHAECRIRDLGEDLLLCQRLSSVLMQERDEAKRQLKGVCDGVNRRCGYDTNQLPLVSVDRLIARHARDRISLVAWVLRNMDQFGCFSGDCPHDLNSECIQSIINQYEEDEAAKAGGCG